MIITCLLLLNLRYIKFNFRVLRLVFDYVLSRDRGKWAKRLKLINYLVTKAVKKIFEFISIAHAYTTKINCYLPLSINLERLKKEI